MPTLCELRDIRKLSFRLDSPAGRVEFAQIQPLMRRLSLAILIWASFSLRNPAQGTLSMSTATGLKPRIMFGGRNAMPEDQVWVELLVEGASGLSGGVGAFAPFTLNLSGANAGLFSRGTITVAGKPPGARVTATLRAWIQPPGGSVSSYCSAYQRDEQTFALILGGEMDAQGAVGLPTSIVTGFRGLNIGGCLSCYDTVPSTVFNPASGVLESSGSYNLQVESALPLDLDQDGAVDLLLVRVGYYRAPDSLAETGALGTFSHSRDYLVKPRVGPLGQIHGAGVCGLSGPAIPVESTNAIPLHFDSTSTRPPWNAWVMIADGRLRDFGYNPVPDGPIKPGEKPQGMLPNPNRRFEYEVADPASVLAERPVVFLRRETVEAGGMVTVTTTLVTQPGQFLTAKEGLARLALGDWIPAVLPGGFDWSPNFFYTPVSADIAQLETTSDGRVIRSIAWAGGYVAVREHGQNWAPDTMTWLELSAGTLPHRISGGHSSVIGGLDNESRRGLVGTRPYELNIERLPLDLNRDGRADFLLDRSTYVVRSPEGLTQLENRELTLESVPPALPSRLSLGRWELGAESDVRTGCFGPGPTNFAVRFPTTAGELAGEILVLNAFTGSVATRYEPVPRQALVPGQLPSVNLNHWRPTLGGLRLTWPAEHTNYFLERSPLDQPAEWRAVGEALPGTWEIPLESSGPALFRLRRR